MKKRIIFVERQAHGAVSIERVFAQVARSLPTDLFDVEFHKLSYGHGLVGILKGLLFFRKRQADIYHITGDIHYIALRLPKKKTVLTIHDLGFLHTNSGVRRSILKKLFLDLPLRVSENVTAVSNTTRDEILSYFPGARDKIRVIENPLIADFTPGREKPFDAECPVILQMGATKNKNIVNLINAVSELKCKLRIVGPLDANIKGELEASGIHYENVDSIDRHQIVEEYRNADIVSFCSTYEGFGLPIIEAQAMRKPVITSALPPMSDIAGGAAVLVDPFDPASIKNAVVKLIDDAGYRKNRVDMGTENIKRFDPKTIADQYCELYLQILDGQN